MVSRLASVIAFLVAIMAVSAWPDSARAASFDCKKATHALEKIVCGNPSISERDDQVAKLYRARLAQVFDKLSFRQSQREWQSWLRNKCVKGCDPTTVSDAYDVRIASLQDNYAENWSANYKTADLLEMTILYFDDVPNEVSIGMRRSRVDDDEETPPLCEFPRNDEMAEMAFAKILSPTLVRFTEKGCTIDLKLTRQKDGHVVAIESIASDGCMSYCNKNAPGLSDRFSPDGGADNSIYDK